MAEFDWVTPAEAARVCRVSRQRISELVRLGVLSSVRQGGRVFVSRRSLECWMLYRRECKRRERKGGGSTK